MIRLFLSTLFFVVSLFGEGFLYKLDNSSKNIYIGGSIHLLRESDHPLPANYLRAFQSSDVAVFEVNLDEFLSPSIQQTLLKEVIYPYGSDATSVLSKKTVEKISDFCRKRYLTPNYFLKFKPWFLSFALLEYELSLLGITQESGVDTYFHEKALQESKTIIGLASAKRHLSVLLSLDEIFDDKAVSSFLDETSSIQVSIERIITAWKKGDDKVMGEFLLDPQLKEYPMLYEKLLVERNREWVGEIQKLILRYDNVFILVGAGHLLGNDSLLKFLQEKNLRFTRLP